MKITARIFLAIFFLLAVGIMESTVSAEVMCSFGLAGGPMHIRGALVQAYFDSTYYEGPGWQTVTTTGDQIQWDAGDGFSGNDNRAYFTLDTNSSEIGVEVWRIQPSAPPCWFEIYEQTPISQNFSILPNWSKQTYHNIGNFLAGLGAGFSIVGAYAGYAGDGLSAFILTTSGVLVGLTGGLLLQVDPWDDAYGYPYEPSYPSADDLGLSYLPAGSYGNAFWDTIANDNNVMVNAAINLNGNLTGANISINRANSCFQIGASCADWQAERARQFLEAANQNAYDGAAAMWELSYQYGQQGFGQDYIDLWNQGADQFWQMYNNGVR